MRASKRVYTSSRHHMDRSPLVALPLSSALAPAFARTPWLLLGRALALSWSISGTVLLLRVQTIDAAATLPMLQLALEGLGIVGLAAALAFLGPGSVDAHKTLQLVWRLEGSSVPTDWIHTLIAWRHLRLLVVGPALVFGLASTTSSNPYRIAHGLLLLLGTLLYAFALSLALTALVHACRKLDRPHGRAIFLGALAAPLLLHSIWATVPSPPGLLRRLAILCLSIAT